jgi:hypothetical protein
MWAIKESVVALTHPGLCEVGAMAQTAWAWSESMVCVMPGARLGRSSLRWSRAMEHLLHTQLSVIYCSASTSLALQRRQRHPPLLSFRSVFTRLQIGCTLHTSSRTIVESWTIGKVNVFNKNTCQLILDESSVEQPLKSWLLRLEF